METHHPLSIFLFFFLFICSSFFSLSDGAYTQWKLPPGVIAPDSFAFDCDGQGPYTGVFDGRIFKWQAQNRSWTEFAVTVPNRNRSLCDNTTDLNLGPRCGRALGLQFYNRTCELYIADAYFGIMKVGRNGGVATRLASSAEGVPFNFTNGVDVDQQTGVVYFTDSSSRYQLRKILALIATGDSTGRVMKYDPQTTQVTVLLRGLKFPNGVVLSGNYSYLLYSLSTSFAIRRYWLTGPRANQTENFALLPGPPDGITRNSKGEYWVAFLKGAGPVPVAIGVRLNEGGRVLQTLFGDGSFQFASQIIENKDSLLVGSLFLPYVGVTNTTT